MEFEALFIVIFVLNAVSHPLWGLYAYPIVGLFIWLCVTYTQYFGDDKRWRNPIKYILLWMPAILFDKVRVWMNA